MWLSSLAKKYNLPTYPVQASTLLVIVWEKLVKISHT